MLQARACPELAEGSSGAVQTHRRTPFVGTGSIPEDEDARGRESACPRSEISPVPAPLGGMVIPFPLIVFSRFFIFFLLGNCLRKGKEYRWNIGG